MIPVIFEFYEKLGVGVKYTLDDSMWSVKFTARSACCYQDGYPTEWGESGDTMTTDFDAAERYVDGYVKRDKCCHFWFGNEDAYLHLCNEVEQFADFMKIVTARCGELMGGFRE